MQGTKEASTAEPQRAQRAQLLELRLCFLSDLCDSAVNPGSEPLRVTRFMTDEDDLRTMLESQWRLNQVDTQVGH